MREVRAECYLYYPSIVAHAVWRRSRLSSTVSEAAAARRRKAKCLLRAKGRKGKRRGYARGVCEIAARYVCAGTRLASKSNVTSVSRTSFHTAPCRAHKRNVSLSSSLSCSPQRTRPYMHASLAIYLYFCLSTNDTEICIHVTLKLRVSKFKFFFK